MSNSTPTTQELLSLLSGVWLSSFEFHSTTRAGDFKSQHYVRMLREGTTLVCESIPELSNSYLVARLSVDGTVATGSWQETTADDGHYKGATYHGSGQLVLSDDGRTLEGKWVGVGKRMDVKTGTWTITYVAPTADGLEPLAAE